jgi:septum formation protein
MKQIILASTSPRRKQLLEILGLDFTVVPSEVEEILDPQLNPRQQVEALSKQKAEAVAQKYSDAIIIGADTMVALGNEVLGKPKDPQDARRMLKLLRGKMHTIVTGFTLIDVKAQRTIVKSVETKVWFRKIEPAEIHAYIEKEKPFDRAGSYSIQDMGSLFVDKIEGDYYGAVGLPLYTLAKELKKLDVSVL